MLLTIVTINYNNVKGLELTLSSVFSQSQQDFEWIVIDGGSSDGSKELIEANANKFSYWVSEADNGIYHAMNKGILKAKGDYILCLNSGDSLYNNLVLEKVLPHLSGNIDILYGNADCVNFCDQSDHIWYLPKILNFEYFTRGALCHQSTFLRRDLFSRVGLYDESFRIASDWYFTLKAITYFSATHRYIDLIICTYDKSGISATQLNLANKERYEILTNDFSFFKNQHQKFGLKQLTLKKLIKFLLPYGLVRFIQKKKAIKTYWDFQE